MRITNIRLRNWRNYKEAEASDLSEIVYLLGPNAAGKSNFLDALRFLRDLAKTRGGGLQDATQKRGGLSKIRCLHARKDPEVSIEVEVSDNGKPKWQYFISFDKDKNNRSCSVKEEKIWQYSGGSKSEILTRPLPEDKEDPARLMQTHLEQVNTNKEFRDLAEFFGGISYVHLVPQLLKFGSSIGGQTLESDPFGQEFLNRIAEANSRTQRSRLTRIENALRAVVPQMEDLSFVQDTSTGKPHLEIKFRHFRPRGARQREDQFSDGTLRLIALFWLLQESDRSPLLLEEPELSLNEEIVAHLPNLIARIRSKSKNKRQVFITTHSYALLSNPGIDPDGLIVVEPSGEGSKLTKPTAYELSALEAGLTPAEVVLPRAKKIDTKQLLLI